MPNPKKIRAAVAEVQDYGDRIYRVALKAEGSLPLFRAGQFLHLTVDEYDPSGGFWPESRVFSIASMPGERVIEIVYSVKGRYTAKMAEYLKPGAPVWLKLPYGDFVIDKLLREGQDAVLIAGGTGISPFVPFVRHMLTADRGPALSRSVVLHYGARFRHHVLWPELWDASCARRVIAARIYIECEDPGKGSSEGAKRRGGRLRIQDIFAESSALRDPAFFLSGPPAMIEAFRGGLSEAGTEGCRIISDDWE